MLVLSLFILIASYYPTTVTQVNEPYFINSFEEDITGDGFREYIRLEGNLFNQNGDYFHNVWIDIQTPFTQQWKIALIPGYRPNLNIVDINNDNILDLFYQTAKDISNKRFDYRLYTVKEGKVEQIPLPHPRLQQGEFVDDFKLKIIMDSDKKPLFIDLGNKKTLYKDLYDAKGKLKIKKNLHIYPIYFLEPIWINEKKGYGLISSQPVKMSDNPDLLGEIKTVWYYHEGKWIVQKGEWVGTAVY